MQRIRVTKLVTGQSIRQHLFSLSGLKLLRRGTKLTDDHLVAIHNCGDADVILANSTGDLVDAGLTERLDVSTLVIGRTMPHAVITTDGRILLDAGEKIEKHHLEALAECGEVFVNKRDAVNQWRERTFMADTLIVELEAQITELPLRVKPEATNDWSAPADPKTCPDLEALSQIRSDQVKLICNLIARIQAGVKVSVSDFEPILQDLLRHLSLFPTRSCQLALLCPRREDYLPDHAYTVAVLAMATAAQLRWPIDDIRDIGLAGLVYDLGMLLVPERIRTARELTDVDLAQVQRHPILSLSLLESVENLSPIIRLAALQHHERENGSGYPIQKRKQQICDYARVLGVCDTYAAATELRHYRESKLPYTSMEELLQSASAQCMWTPAVRALIQAVGLFPVGSYVKLSDDRNAHVIACNPKSMDRPTVQCVDRDGKPSGPSVDLSLKNSANLTVVRPLSSPTG